MPFLELKDIGKIYVNDGNVSVGIRGVNLSFEKGEFVAVTGKSGSGKSTFLNVISGMDSYEEGEIFIEGEPTSHFVQPDWEQYRSKYISFIFQDYNIIESFTVLQNVELALMDIEDKKERRRRALELIDRVGLASKIKQKGSKLSGGQKQRTVIARALAKDSPIILADEPTGNLDSVTSAEIIELLHEVSKNKLLIVVTHNYEEVEKHATRHIRFFDGAVETDNVIIQPLASENVEKPKEEKKTSKEKKKNIKNGITLGKAIFTSRPKLSFFLCLLMIIGTLSVFAITSFCGDAATIFEKNYMFNNIEGRLIVTKRNGEIITKEELEQIKNSYGAKSVLHYDVLLDGFYGSNFSYFNAERGYDSHFYLKCTYGETFGEDIIGKYPEKEDEVFLFLPISQSIHFGKDELILKEIKHNEIKYKVSGVKYFYDNNLKGKCLFTQKGFEIATALYYQTNRSEVKITVDIWNENDKTRSDQFYFYKFTPSFEVEEGKIYINNQAYQNAVSMYKDNLSSEITLQTIYYNYNYNYGNDGKQTDFIKKMGKEYLSDKKIASENYGEILIHPYLLTEIVEEVLEKSYKQASVFFESTEKAYEVAEILNKENYLAVPSDTTYSLAPEEAIITVFAALFTGVLWFFSIVFIAFFINLCTSRTIGAFKGDMAIMRSMGIHVKVIKIGMYVRMFVSLIPAFISVICAAVFVFTSPRLNQYFTFLYPFHYVLIVAGIIILVLRITKKQIKKLFGESVKKSLKGGIAE